MLLANYRSPTLRITGVLTMKTTYIVLENKLTDTDERVPATYYIATE